MTEAPADSLVLTAARLAGTDHDDVAPRCLVIEQGRISHVVSMDQAQRFEGARQTIDLGGRLLTPAFVDAHVHTVQAGQALSGLDLTGVSSREDLLDRVSRHAYDLPAERVLVGAGWDESTWADPTLPSSEEMQRAAPGRSMLLSRIDGHSALASLELLARVPAAAGADGYSDSGRVERDAKMQLVLALNELIGPDERSDAARVALAQMASLGIAAFHEAAAPHIGPAYELALVQAAAADLGLHPTLYWGEHLGFDTMNMLARQGVHLAGLAGDLNADGALGSRTAALCRPYADDPSSCGHAALEAAQIAHHVVECTRRGIQAGFHCIGDAALEAVGEGFARAADELGVEQIRQGRHRLEHVEMPSPQVLRILAHCGVVASVQPMFDGLWGGPSAMYAERLGERWEAVNRFADHLAAGLCLAFGSDAPVTPLGPWAAVHAAVHHRTPGQSLALAEALWAHTAGGWRAAGIDDAGEIAVGQRAYLAAWDATEVPAENHEMRCLLTVADGTPIHSQLA